ncbi:maltose ABC transporter permease MalF [Pasteurella skyensis]|uniref:Maltose/maltodextrin transport system permease protein n=1 Tax=Phocoenobacter skyensis TaxID=97481 RepID=A0AAJ6N9K1_9PAST|nr:maltose ABC transporter permease MalF [Pasteurella skyensis]MDP8162262.1 maltose ABC transporter permease MalF [Pasteurella skyensis]MDP8172726.1 maltose ABC transporter permease MalF [Pasteurella skyensis]MDP8176888.1 maltose ABC transporter permease MalF [Pasteurella skyensis]MDP8179226.1 maltose ABC transporter permease MalF [Pasteurella skyensis]MDP8183319.1 maltose ABC transporter permease MalF [Pasteurella skyensis]
MLTSIETPPTNLQIWGKRLCVGLLYLLAFYLVFTIYLQGEIIFALLVLVVLTSGIYVFSSGRAYRWRYLYPGVSAIGIFIIFPLLMTVIIAFTNYSGSNRLSFEQVVSQLQSQKFAFGERFNFKLLAVENNQYQLTLNNTKLQKNYLSAPLNLTKLPKELSVNEVAQLPKGKVAPLKVVIKNRTNLQAVNVLLPSNESLTMSSLRQFTAQKKRYDFDKNSQILMNNETGEKYKANNEIGFFQKIDEQGNFVEQRLEPGYIVAAGWTNYIKILTDKGVQEPFVKIFIWTVIFAFLTVVFTVFLGMIFASLVQWEPLKGKAVYRLLLILPYAVPGFISILVFKGLFNQSFGEINLILNQLFGIRPEWFNDPTLAKSMLLIVNTWLGYPYMMIVCMGLLKAIPNDLYEASAIDGATMWQNFTKITMPMLLKPLMPLMIASFAFNFNNFVLIQLLTLGAPNMVGTTTPAGHTDLLVSYTYRIAFEGSGTQDFGLAAAIAVIIFLLVSILALFQIRLTKLQQD